MNKQDIFITIVTLIVLSICCYGLCYRRLLADGTDKRAARKATFVIFSICLVITLTTYHLFIYVL